VGIAPPAARAFRPAARHRHAASSLFTKSFNFLAGLKKGFSLRARQLFFSPVLGDANRCGRRRFGCVGGSWPKIRENLNSCRPLQKRERDSMMLVQQSSLPAHPPPLSLELFARHSVNRNTSSISPPSSASVLAHRETRLANFA